MSSKFRLTKTACYIGYVVQAIINNFLPILFIALQSVYGLGYEKLARLIVVNFVTQMITDLLTPRIVGVIGYKRAAVICQGAAAVGLVMLGVLPKLMSNTYLAIMLSIVVYAFGSGLIEVIISPIIETLSTENKSGNMAFLHSFYCWGQAFTIIVTTLLVLVFGYKDWQFIPLIWAVVPFVNMFVFLKSPIIEPQKNHKSFPFLKLFKMRKFRLYMIMMLCAGAAEIAMAEWASMFVQQALGVSKVIGDLAGPCAFAIFMATGRVWYSLVSEKIDFKKTLVVLSALCAVCYLVVAICDVAFVSMIFCALCGFTVSISWPGILSLGAKDFAEGSSVMFSVFAMCGDTGCCLGPWVIGIVADSYGLNVGFAVATVFPLLMIMTTAMSMKKIKVANWGE